MLLKIRILFISNMHINQFLQRFRSLFEYFTNQPSRNRFTTINRWLFLLFIGIIPFRIFRHHKIIAFANWPLIKLAFLNIQFQRRLQWSSQRLTFFYWRFAQVISFSRFRQSFSFALINIFIINISQYLIVIIGLILLFL